MPELSGWPRQATCASCDRFLPPKMAVRLQDDSFEYLCDVCFATLVVSSLNGLKMSEVLNELCAM
jgi:hypothetical protein